MTSFLSVLHYDSVIKLPFSSFAPLGTKHTKEPKAKGAEKSSFETLLTNLKVIKCNLSVLPKFW